MADSFSPPEGVRAEARRALKWIEEGHAGGGFTDVGRKRASDLARGASVSLRTIKRMNSYLARHEVDKQGKGWSQGSDGYPSAGRVAWAAWGGDAAKAWVGKILRSVEKSVDAIATDPEQMDLDLALGWAEGEIAWEELPQNVQDAIDEAMVGEVPEDGSVDAMVKADEQTELLHKADSEHRFTLGPWYIPNRYDAHGEWTDADELQKALWEYVRTGDRDIRLQHNRDIVAGEWLEAMSFPVPVSIGMQKAGEAKQVTYPSGTVFLGVQWKPWAWDMVKEGKIRGFSIGGAAARIEMAMPDDMQKASFGGDRSEAGRYAAQQRWKNSSGQTGVRMAEDVAAHIAGRLAMARARKAAMAEERGEKSLWERIKFVFSKEYTNPEPLARKWVKEAARQSIKRGLTVDPQMAQVVGLPSGKKVILDRGKLTTVGKADRERVKAEVLAKQQPTSSQVHVDTIMGGKKRKKKRPSRAEVLKGGGLDKWFDEKWVDISRPKEGGGFEECGRPDANDGKYPKCVPASTAAKMSARQRRSAIRRKREAESGEKREGKKPIYVETFKKVRNVPTDMKLYSRVKAAAKKKFDVYPSAYANAWLVQEYKRRGGGYKVEKATFGGDRSEAGRYAANIRWQRYAAGAGSVPVPRTAAGKRLLRTITTKHCGSSLVTNCDLDGLAREMESRGLTMDSPEAPELVYKYLSPERKALWDASIADSLRGVPQRGVGESVIWVKGGGGASGKSTSDTKGMDNPPPPTEEDVVKGKAPKAEAVLVNSDDWKLKSPDFKAINARAMADADKIIRQKGLDPDSPEAEDERQTQLRKRLAAGYVHEESSMVAKLILYAAIRSGRDVVVDGTMDNGVDKRMAELRLMRQLGAAKIHGLFFSCDTDEALLRAQRRERDRTSDSYGRIVHPDSLKVAHEKVSANFPRYLQERVFDSVVLYDTNQRPSRLVYKQSEGKEGGVVDAGLYQDFLDKSTKKD